MNYKNIRNSSADVDFLNFIADLITNIILE